MVLMCICTLIAVVKRDVERQRATAESQGALAGR